MGTKSSPEVRPEIIYVKYVMIKKKSVRLYYGNKVYPLVFRYDDGDSFDVAYTVKIGEYLYKEETNGKVKLSKNFPKFTVSGQVKYVCPDGKLILDENPSQTTISWPLYWKEATVGSSIFVECEFKDGKLIPIQK